MLSLPSRERGLKLHPVKEISCSLLSLPSRERGLKYVNTTCTPERFVAPLAGAWIEIRFRVKASRGIEVAPLAGAWIEILL